MAERLYYTDSFLREFDGRVVSCETADGRFRVRLDRTAFYPTSGGQPNDTGKLGEAAVVDVIDVEGKEIVHVTDREVAIGPVHGVIDWARRFDHMQQHTGQHLLSATFIELFKFPTVSFHLGRENSTIDLAAPLAVQRQLEESERRVNEIIFEDRPIAVSFATAKELAASGVRKAVEREGLLRVIEMEGFDRQPCGGTHLARTGQAGLLLIRKCEKQKQNWRIDFVCGGRALAAARGDFSTLRKSAEVLSCGMPEVPAVVQKFADERRAAQRQIKQLHERVAEFEAKSLLAGTVPSCEGAARVVTAVFDTAEPGYLGLLATRMIAEPCVQALLATRVGGVIVFAQSGGFDADMGALLREAVSAAGGKGGGTKTFAEGSVADLAQIDAVIKRTAERLRRKSSSRE